MSKHVYYEEEFENALRNVKQSHTDYVKYLQQQMYDYKKKYEQTSVALEEALERISVLEKKVEEAHESRNVMYKKVHEMKKNHENLSTFKQSIAHMLGYEKENGVQDHKSVLQGLLDKGTTSTATSGRHSTGSTVKKNSVTFSIDENASMRRQEARSPLASTKITGILTNTERERSSDLTQRRRSFDSDRAYNSSPTKYEYNLDRVTKAYPVSPKLINSPTKSSSTTTTSATRRYAERSIEEEENSTSVEQLYQRTKTLLSSTEFAEFAKQIRRLNLGEQSVDDTLDTIQKIFGPDRQYLFRQLSRIIRK